MHLSFLWPKEVRPGHDTGGQAARERAEKELVRVRAETPYYAGLGSDLRYLRERNHIAENIRITLRRG